MSTRRVSPNLLKVQAAASFSLILAPLALPQGLRLRKTATRLPEAPGERSGLTPGADPVLRVLAVGESPLAGVGLDEQSQGLAARLAERLSEATGRAVQWRTAARGGLTAAALREKLVPGLAPEPADLILIGLGVNDSLALRSARRWQRDLEDLIKELHARTGPAPVLLAGVPDMYHFPLLPSPLRLLLGSRSRLLDRAAARLAARREHTNYVSMALDARSTELFCEDGFHPNRDGHIQWAEQLTPAALQLLGR
ncbi:MAG: SGNH/GDSL hydrolase family protein [Wenzhouxiangella sp.]|nr:MAG: SGNH/GDSL hydrolase family protein [Wenzhouxiangella sp.]